MVMRVCGAELTGYKMGTIALQLVHSRYLFKYPLMILVKVDSLVAQLICILMLNICRSFQLCELSNG